jgi:hypothetical protein
VPIINPTLQLQRWGVEPWALFDYYRNPTRVDADADHPNGQNPVLFVRHGGGGTGGDYSEWRDTTVTGTTWYFLRWLLGDQAANESPRHWDICAFESGQRANFAYGGYSPPHVVPFPRSESLLFPATVRDCQRAIASITHMHRELGFHPEKRGGFGHSFGATLMGLSQLAPALEGSGGSSTWQEGTDDPRTHDSRLKFLLFQEGQVDFRKVVGGIYDGLDYLHYSTAGGWFGTSGLAYPNGFAAVKAETREMASILRYFQVGDVDGYSSWYVTWDAQGDHVHPYTNPHDSQQRTDLLAAIAAAGLVANAAPIDAAFVNTLWPAGPGATELALYQTIEGWMAAKVLA